MAAMVGEYGEDVEMQVDAGLGGGPSSAAEGKRKTEEQKRLFRIHKTILKMLKKRGYVIPDKNIEQSYNDFIMKYGDDEYTDDCFLQEQQDGSNGEKDEVGSTFWGIMYIYIYPHV